MINVNKKKIAATQYRIKTLPKYVDEVINASRKRDCKEIIDEFETGIQRNTLGLQPLKKTTVERKQAQGFSKFPLYGAGEMKKDRAFYKMLRIKKMNSGWKVTASNKLHWSGKIKLSDLLKIHEKGCIIKNGFGKGILIRLPPRPALNRAYNKWLRKYKKKNKDPEIIKAVNAYIKTGKDELLKGIMKRMEVKVTNDN